MIRLLSPLVVSTVVIVSLLAALRLILAPESWPSSLIALAFLPLALGVLMLRARKQNQGKNQVQTSGKTRAALVGAGAALAASLFLSITVELGLTEESIKQNFRFLGALLPALAAIAFDLFTARLEKKEKDKRD